MEDLLHTNKLIAEFMGMNLENYPSKIPSYIEVCGNPMNDKNIKKYTYHTSWDWIMPVIEKIEAIDTHPIFHSLNLKFRFYIMGNYCEITMGQGWENEPGHFKANGPTKIKAVYKCVSNFCQWYYENKFHEK